MEAALLCNLLPSVLLADLEQQIGLLTLPLLPPMAATSLAVIYYAMWCGSCQVPHCPCVQGPPSITEHTALQEMFSQSGQKKKQNGNPVPGSRGRATPLVT